MALNIYINQSLVLEYAPSVGTPGQQRSFLEKMDTDMDAGIALGDERIEQPDTMQRAFYVCANLIYALQHEHTEMVQIMCCYLNQRLPHLRQIQATEQGDDLTTRLVFADELGDDQA